MIIKAAFTQFYRALYGFVLRTIGLAERRCSYCGKLMGYRYGKNFRGDEFVFYVSHGICLDCNEEQFPPEWMDPATGNIYDGPQPRRRQRRSKKNRRRQAGGWSGAIAI